MDAHLECYLEWLRAHGVTPELASSLIRDDDVDPMVTGAPALLRSFDFGAGHVFVERRDPEARGQADYATVSVLSVMQDLGWPKRGDQVFEIGCGTAVLSAYAAHCGAEVFATEVDPRAAAQARVHLKPYGAKAQVFIGSLLDPLPRNLHPDLLLANVPHKPALAACTFPEFSLAGPYGAALHTQLLEGLIARAKPLPRTVLFLHSLPHPRLHALYATHYQLTLRRYRLRYLDAAEESGLRAMGEKRWREIGIHLTPAQDRLAMVTCTFSAEPRLKQANP